MTKAILTTSITQTKTLYKIVIAIPKVKIPTLAHLYELRRVAHESTIKGLKEVGVL